MARKDGLIPRLDADLVALDALVPRRCAPALDRRDVCRTRTTLFVEAVQRARSQVLCLSNNKLSSQALRSPRPAGAKRW